MEPECFICDDQKSFRCDLCMGRGHHVELYLTHDYSNNGAVLSKEKCDECNGTGRIQCCN